MATRISLEFGLSWTNDPWQAGHCLYLTTIDGASMYCPANPNANAQALACHG
jgi:hypothetical protein